MAKTNRAALINNTLELMGLLFFFFFITVYVMRFYLKIPLLLIDTFFLTIVKFFPKFSEISLWTA